MAGTTMTCPVCLATERIRYDNLDTDHNLDYEDTPFYLNKKIPYCRKCNLPVIVTWGFQEYAKKIYDSLLKFDIARLNDCIHKGYFAEAILMLHLQITNRLAFLLLRSLPTGKANSKTIEEFFDNGGAYNLINLAFVYGHLEKTQFDILIRFNTLRNKFAHSFKERQKLDFGQMRELIDESKKIEECLSKK